MLTFLGVGGVQVNSFGEIWLQASDDVPSTDSHGLDPGVTRNGTNICIHATASLF